MITETLKVTGSVTIVKYDENGKKIQEVKNNNLVVDIGKEHIAALLAGESPAPISHMAVGHNATPTSGLDTELTQEASNGRVSIPPGLRLLNIVDYTGIFPATYATGSLYEAGLFNAAAGGTMLSRVTFPEVVKGPTDTIAITWSIRVS